MGVHSGVCADAQPDVSGDAIGIVVQCEHFSGVTGTEHQAGRMDEVGRRSFPGDEKEYAC